MGLKGAFDKVFGTHSTRELKRMEVIVDMIEELEDEYRKLSDYELKDKTRQFKERLANGEELEMLLPEAFATVREAADRVLGMRPYRVQLIGGIVLFQGRIAEMKTGEGKTLVATLPSYLAALEGKGVHIVSVNDYLISRDAAWMGKVHEFLGLTVGVIIHGLTNEQRRAAYNADITYATNNEMGFDYLRDNMAAYKTDMVTRGRRFAIVDEVDSILIDEARTPLIISGQGEESTELYQRADRLARSMKRKVVRKLEAKEEHEGLSEGFDYIVDEQANTATLTQEGIAKAEKFFGVEDITEPEHSTILHHTQQAIKAYGTMHRDQDYVVKDGEVIIVDEFTGRLMQGRRYSEGLHQAIEAKENVKVERESKTLATITFQNFFRLYDKLSGMTGTALTEQEEFQAIYKLDIIEVPTNKPMARTDLADSVYKDVPNKTNAIIQQIKDCHAKGQPVLVGTVTIENSEKLSHALKREGIPHEVLNAKHHEREAEIIAQAGRLGTVTIATNMAGRGTDIMLGGNPEHLAKAELKKKLPADATPEQEAKLYAELLSKHKNLTDAEARKVVEAGGLFILGTERHESRRIDNQLRGRAGRQGDPGASRFFLSLEDDLMRLFGGDRVRGIIEALNAPDDQAIEAKMLTNMIESAQKRVESRNFQTRKHVLEYDDVMNKQREIIYKERAQVLDGADLKDNITRMIDGRIDHAVGAAFGDNHIIADAAQIEALFAQFYGIFLKPGEYSYTDDEIQNLNPEEVGEKLKTIAHEVYDKRESDVTPQLMREIERWALLRAVDTHWMDHIDAMHELRQGIGLRAYAQTDPVKAYTSEGFEMFDAMTADIQEETIRMVYSVRAQGKDAPKRERVAKVMFEGGGEPAKKKPVKRAAPKVGANDPCPCGSGLKYKKCCRDKENAANG